MKPLLVVNFIVLFILLVNSIIRDVQYQREGAGDLRNRVVGARLTEAGRDPYFYKWKQGDSYAYLDYGNADSNIVSTITATPFFHRLMAPICNFPEKTIAMLWFVLEYLGLLIIIGAGVLLCTTPMQKIVVVNTGILFTYTHAWMFHLLEGQLYIFIAALMMLIALFVIRYFSSKVFLILASLLAVSLILIRPISAVILLPFLFSFRKYRGYVVAIAIFSAVYAVFAVTNKNEKQQWNNYSKAMAEQVKVHQKLPHLTVAPGKLPALTTLEGLNLEDQKEAALNNPFPNHSENGNVFFVYRVFTHHTMPLPVLYALYLFVMLLLLVLVFRKYRKGGLNDRQLLLFGFILYMLTELFTPIYRHQYNSVQWLPLILLAVSMQKGVITFSQVLIFLGLILNITNTPLLPIRHTIGEYLMLTGLLLVVFTEDTHQKESGSYFRKER